MIIGSRQSAHNMSFSQFDRAVEISPYEGVLRMAGRITSVLAGRSLCQMRYFRGAKGDFVFSRDP
jgi:hypothetical protein